MTLSVGDPAPDFSAVDQHGLSHQLSDYQGKWIVLYFYPEDDTPGCTTEACSFRDNYAELHQLAGVLGVSADSAESHHNFSEKHHLPFPLLIDQNQKIIQAYQADGLIFKKRVTFVIDPNGKIAKIYQKVNVLSHGKSVLKDLKNLQAKS